MARLDDIVIKPAKGTVRVATFDVREMVVVLFEGVMELKHPPHQTLHEAADFLRERDPQLYASLHRAAIRAMEYVADRFDHTEPEQMQ